MPKVVKTMSMGEAFPSKRPRLRERMLEGSKAIIESLQPGEIKIVEPEEGERIPTLRNWMKKAAEELGRNIGVRKVRGQEQLMVWEMSEEEIKKKKALSEKMRERRRKALEKARAVKKK